MAAKQVDTV